MKLINLFFSIALILTLLKATSGQNLHLTIINRDTIYNDQEKPWQYLTIKITNASEDTFYLPGYRMAQVRLPKFHLGPELTEEANEWVKKKGANLISFFTNSKIDNGMLYLFVKDIDKDSLIGLKQFYFTRDWLKDESIANYDSLSDPYQLGAYALFRLQRMLTLPPHMSIEKEFFCDFSGFELQKGKHYEAFVVYAFNKSGLHRSEIFGPFTNKYNYPETSLVSNEIILIWKNRWK